MEAKKSPNVLSASLRPREAVDVIQPEGLRPEGLMVSVSVWVSKPENQEHRCWRAGRDGCFSSCKCTLALRLPLTSVWAHSGLGDAHPRGWGPSLLSIHSNANLFWKRPPSTPRNHVLSATWASLGPVRLTGKHYKFTPCLLHTHTHLFKPYSISK